MQRPGIAKPPVVHAAHIGPAETERRSTGRQSRPNPVRYIVIAFAAALVVLAGLVVWYEASHGGRVYRGVKVLNTDVSGLTRDEARGAVTQATAAYPSDTIRVAGEGRDWTFSPADIGLMADVEQTTDAALAIGRTGDFFSNLGSQLNTLFGGAQVTPVLKYDQARLDAAVAQIAADVDRPGDAVGVGLVRFEVAQDPEIWRYTLVMIRTPDEMLEYMREAIERHRKDLHAHCYRMLGSLHDAEDALQEALLRAWRGLARFEGRSSLRTWLYTIATNTCLDVIHRRPKRVLPVDYGPKTDPHDGPGDPIIESVWVEPYPDETLGVEDGYAAPEARYEQRESVELAFIAALQHLPPGQRAVLILRDVLGFSARETADILDTKPTSVDSVLQRAHKNVDARLPEQSQQAALRSLGDTELREIVDGYIEAWERADIDTIVTMLAEEATLDMPPDRRHEAHDRLEDGRLAAAVDADQRADRAWIELEARVPLARGSHQRQRAAGVRPLHLERAGRRLRPARDQRAHAAGHTDRGHHDLPRSGGTGTLRATGPDRAVSALGSTWKLASQWTR